MSNEVFKLMGTIAISNSQANDAIDETTSKASSASNKLNGAFGKIGGFALGAGKVIAAGVGAAATAFTALGASAVNYNAQMEQYNTSFEVMLGSEEKALALVADLKEKAAKTPFEMSDLANTTQLLLNYGLSAEEATEKMMMLGDIAQGDAQKMERVANAYGQMSSAGKVSLEDVKQMIEAGFNPLQEISDSTGESMETLYDRISKGTISVDEITASMTRATSEGGKYFQSMEKQSQTFSGRLSTLKDTIDSKLGEAFASVSVVLTEKVLPVFTTFAEEYIPKLGVIVEQIIPPLMSVGETALPLMVSAFESLVPLAMQMAETCLPLFASTLQTLLPVAIELVSAALPQALQIIQRLLPPLLLIISKALPPLVKLLTPILDLISPILDVLMPVLDLVVALLGPIMSLLSTGLPIITELAGMIVGMLLPVIQQICTFIENYLVPVIQFVFDLLGGPVFESILLTISTMVDGIMNIVSGVFSYIEGLIKFYMAIFTGDWKGALDAIVQMLSAIGSILWGLIESVFFGIISAVKMYWEEIVTFFTESIPNFVSNIITWIQGVMPELIAFLQELPVKVAEWLLATTQKIIDWRNDLKEKGIEAIKGLIDGILEKAKDIPEKVLEIGKNIVDGVWKGIEEAKDQFMENVSGFFTGIIDGAKETLDINSPSKKFEWIGEMCVSGFDKGAEPLTSGSAFEDVALASTPQAMASNVGAGGGIDYDLMTQCFIKALQTVAPELRSNVSVQGDAKGMFRVMQKEASIYKKSTGQGAFA